MFYLSANTDNSIFKVKKSYSIDYAPPQVHYIHLGQVFGPSTFLRHCIFLYAGLNLPSSLSLPGPSKGSLRLVMAN